MKKRRKFCSQCRKEIGLSWGDNERHGRKLYCTSCADEINRQQLETAKVEDRHFEVNALKTWIGDEEDRDNE